MVLAECDPQQIQLGLNGPREPSASWVPGGHFTLIGGCWGSHPATNRLLACRQILISRGRRALRHYLHLGGAVALRRPTKSLRRLKAPYGDLRRRGAGIRALTARAPPPQNNKPPAGFEPPLSPIAGDCAKEAPPPQNEGRRQGSNQRSPPSQATVLTVQPIRLLTVVYLNFIGIAPHREKF